MRNRIKGGLGDNVPYSKVNKTQLRMGVRVEMEHTKDSRLAKEIAKDHLTEYPNYYTELQKMEKKMKKKQGWYGDRKGHRKAALKGKGKFRVCKKCRFRIPENEWKMFGECGQCGSKRYEWVHYNKQ